MEILDAYGGLEDQRKEFSSNVDYLSDLERKKSELIVDEDNKRITMEGESIDLDGLNPLHLEKFVQLFTDLEVRADNSADFFFLCLLCLPIRARFVSTRHWLFSPVFSKAQQIRV